jgi:hypothetical protein
MTAVCTKVYFYLYTSVPFETFAIMATGISWSSVAHLQDVNKEDWRAVNEWIQAVLAGLPSLGLKTIQQLGGMFIAIVDQ